MTSRIQVARQSEPRVSTSLIPKSAHSLQTDSRSVAASSYSCNVPFNFGEVAVLSAGETAHANQKGPLPWPMQAKLEVGAANDPLEREADRVADRVMHMPAPPPTFSSASGAVMQRQCKACAQEEEQHKVRRKCDSCADEDKKELEGETHEKLSRKESVSTAAGDRTSAPAIVGKVLESPGQPLDRETRAFMEPRFGYDFSHVRIHADPRAAESSRLVKALAYTIGRDVVFGTGQYTPGTHDGNLLLAHELSHVVQQGSAELSSAGTADGTVRRQSAVSAPEDRIDDVPAPEPLEKPRLPPPNKAPSCAEICGDKENCIQGPGEHCSDDATKAAMAAWKSAADNLTKAINLMDNSPDSDTLRMSLKSNFNWSKGNSPADLPAQVRKTLGDGLSKFSENLCIKCRDCAPTTVAHIEQARGVNCLDSNCFVICPAFGGSSTSTQAHTLLHELLHRVVTGAVEDLYRGQPGYPGPPSTALKMPDPFASLVDDLAGGGSAPSPAPTPPKTKPSATGP